MEYSQKELKKGVKLHILNRDNFKTNTIAVFLTTKLNRETITYEALLPAILRRGTNNIKNQKEISEKLENLYGASFNCGIEKIGDNHVLKFYIESLDDIFSLDKNEGILDESICMIFDIIFNPLILNNKFNKQYVIEEKENLRKIIKSKIDNKRRYSYIRCIEEMYKSKPYGLFEYGYEEDLANIDESNLYKAYLNFIRTCKIDIFLSGNINEKIIKSLESNKYVEQLNERIPDFIKNSKENLNNKQINIVQEKMDVVQGNLIIGLDFEDQTDNIAAINMYNAILGGGANSKLFQNVREKASLAYTSGSVYLKTKNNIIIRSGIEINNYDKALDIIKQQLQQMKNGDFNEKDINAAKELIIAGLNSIKDEQFTSISYKMNKEITDNDDEIDEMVKKINIVTKQDVIDVANKIKINTIYFLRN